MLACTETEPADTMTAGSEESTFRAATAGSTLVAVLSTGEADSTAEADSAEADSTEAVEMEAVVRAGAAETEVSFSLRLGIDYRVAITRSTLATSGG
jgi:hypothetical protein